MSFNPPWIMSNCVEIVQNPVEVKKLNSNVNSVLNHLLQIKEIDKQLLLVTKLGCTEVNIIPQHTITCSTSTIEILQRGGKDVQSSQ